MLPDPNFVRIAFFGCEKGCKSCKCLIYTLYCGERGSCTVKTGQTMQFTASPYEGFSFVHWEDMDSGKIITTTAKFQRYMKGDFRVRAVFKRSGFIWGQPN